jgi:tetratricopeptide (TPR) repeat protein
VARKPTKARAQTKHGPDAAQLKAVERLLEEEKYKEAIRRVKHLVQRYPDHGGLRRALVEALEYGQGPRAAALAAFAWAERRPNSLPAQEALLHFAQALHHPMLADRTAGKVRELGGATPGFPLDPALKASMLVLPDGTRTSVEDLERFDLGKLHQDGEDFRGAARWLAGLDLLPARNNYALALFHLNRIDDAYDAFMAGWRADPDNLFGLGWATRLRLYRGDDTGAQGLCAPLGAATARRLDDALPQLDALLLLREDALAWQAFERARASDWFAHAQDIGGAWLRHFGGCAAARLGKGEDARRWWREALALKADLQPAGVNLGLSEREGSAPAYPTVFDVRQAVPITWTQALRDQKGEATAALDALTASNAYLEALYRSADETLRTLVGVVLKQRVKQSDADAARLLKAFAQLPVGTKKERFGLLGFLRSQGVLARNEPAALWDGTKLRQVKVTGTEIYREAKESDLPPDLEVVLGEAIVLQNSGREEEAETRLNAILQRVPDHAVALGNLAAVRSAQGRDTEALTLLRAVVEKHPDYLFARCNLARTLIEDGEIDDAERLLDGLAERDRLHIQEVFALYGALAMLNRAKGEEEAAQSLLSSLESMVEDEDDERRFAQVKRAIERLDPVQRFRGLLESLLKADAKPADRRR